MDEKFIRDRITELRLQKDVPERKMSIELGHSTSQNTPRQYSKGQSNISASWMKKRPG